MFRKFVIMTDLFFYFFIFLKKLNFLDKDNKFFPWVENRVFYLKKLNFLGEYENFSVWWKNCVLGNNHYKYYFFRQKIGIFVCYIFWLTGPFHCSIDYLSLSPRLSAIYLNKHYSISVASDLQPSPWSCFCFMDVVLVPFFCYFIYLFLYSQIRSTLALNVVRWRVKVPPSFLMTFN